MGIFNGQYCELVDNRRPPPPTYRPQETTPPETMLWRRSFPTMLLTLPFSSSLIPCLNYCRASRCWMPAFAVKPRVMSSSTNLFHAPPPHHHHDTPVVTSFNHRRYNSIQRSVYVLQTRLMSISDASSSSPERTFILRFDSTVDRDTKDAVLGIAIYDSVDGSTLWSGHRFLPVIGSGDKKDMGNITSNVADYMALLDGLRIIDNLMNSDSNTSQTPSRRVEIQTANEVIAKHLIGTFKCTSKNLKPWYDRVSKSIRESFDNVNVEKIDRVESKFVKKESMTAVKERRSGESYMTMVQELK